MTKNNRNLLIMLIIIAIVFLYNLIFPTTKDSNVILFKKIKDRNIKAIVLRKTIDHSNHGATYVVYGKDSLPTNSEWNEKIKVGDSIIKPLDSLKMTIKNASNIETFDYQEEETSHTKFNTDF